MRDISVVRDKDHPTDWRVEDINSDGEGGCDIAIFSGPHAEERAEMFGAWLEMHRRREAVRQRKSV